MMVEYESKELAYYAGFEHGCEFVDDLYLRFDMYVFVSGCVVSFGFGLLACLWLF